MLLQSQRNPPINPRPESHPKKKPKSKILKIPSFSSWTSLFSWIFLNWWPDLPPILLHLDLQVFMSQFLLRRILLLLEANLLRAKDVFFLIEFESVKIHVKHRDRRDLKATVLNLNTFFMLSGVISLRPWRKHVSLITKSSILWLIFAKCVFTSFYWWNAHLICLCVKSQKITLEVNL